MNAASPRARARFNPGTYVSARRTAAQIAEQEARYQVAEILRTRPYLDLTVQNMQEARRPWTEVLECVRGT